MVLLFSSEQILSVLTARGRDWLTTKAVIDAMGHDPEVTENRLAAVQMLSRLQRDKLVDMEFPLGKPTLWRLHAAEADLAAL